MQAIEIEALTRAGRRRPGECSALAHERGADEREESVGVLGTLDHFDVAADERLSGHSPFSDIEE